MIFRLVIILSIVAQSFVSFSQNYENIDSLIYATTHSKDFLEKAKIANLIADQLNQSQSYAVALEYARSAEEFIGGNKSDDAIQVLAESKQHQGKALTQIGDYAGALQALLDGDAFYNQLLRENKSQKEIKIIKRKLADSYNAKGQVHLLQKNFNKASDNYFRALKILSSLQDKQGMADAYNNSGKLVFLSGNIDSALVYYNMSLQLRLDIGDKKGVSGSYNNIGLCYQLKGIIHQENGDYEKSKKEIFQALDYFTKSLKLTKELGNKFDIAGTSINIGRFYIKFEMYEEAEKHLLQAIKFSIEIGANARLKDAYETMAFLYEDLDRPQDALEYYKLYKAVSDDLTVFQKQQELKMLEAQAEFEKQSLAERQKLEQRAARNQLVIWFTVGGLIIVIGFTIFLLNRFRVISKQKDLIENQNSALEGANAEINKQNKKITDSINYAETIQNAILQSKNKDGLGDHFIFFQPRDVVSGDFYWTHTTQDNKVIWTAADCTGHGVPGALMSMIGTSLLNEIVIEKGITSSEKILSELKMLLIKTFGQTESSISKDGMDMALCVWDKTTNTLEFSGANNPLYLIRKGIGKVKLDVPGRTRTHGDDLVEIRGDKKSISFEEGKEGTFTKNTFKVCKGDILITFSDGYPDQFGGPNQKKFTYPQFKDLLLEIQEKDIVTQGQVIESKYFEWKASEDQIDDVCVFGVKIS